MPAMKSKVKPAAKTGTKPVAPAAPAVKAKAATAAGPVVVQPGLPNLAPNLNPAQYRGAVQVKPFVGWLLLVLLAVLVGGLLAAQLLVSQRLSQLVDETATRVALQGQNRSILVAAWANSHNRLADNIAGADITRLWLADRVGGLSDRSLIGVVRAQTPYIQQLLEDLTQRHGQVAAHILQRSGQIVLGNGPLPANLAAAQGAVQQVVQQARGTMLPIRMAAGVGPVMDILRPIIAQQGNVPGTPAVLGVLWMTVPVGPALAELVQATPLDRVGERTALMQAAGSGTQLIGRTSMATVPVALTDLIGKAEGSRVVLNSPIDGEAVFAAILPVAGTPLALLQEYRANDALALLDLYKPGLYAVVGLLAAMLGALMLALILHLMGQRNTTRVKLLGQTMDAMVRVVEARDPYLAGHHQRVARLALAMSNALRLSVGERATLYYAAQLAAVGRLLVPNQMLGQKGSFSTAERAALQQHINQALTILGDLDFDLPIVPVIVQMYERVDGSGYPRQLLGHQMHRMAKVLGAADAFAAMTADRAHRKALTKAEALKLMTTGAFDPDVLATLRAVAR